MDAEEGLDQRRVNIMQSADQLWVGRKREDQETLPLSGGETWRDDRAISDMGTSAEKVQS